MGVRTDGYASQSLQLRPRAREGPGQERAPNQMTDAMLENLDSDDDPQSRATTQAGSSSGALDEPGTEVPEPVITVEYVEERNLDLDLIRESWGLLRMLPLPQPVTIVVTGDMALSLEVHEHQLYRSWTALRTSGKVTAKAVIDAHGRMAILVDAGRVPADPFGANSTARPPGAHSDAPLERLLEHEGLHLIVRARHEGADVTRCECEFDGDHAFDQFRMIAALAVEEFRVEREQCTAGHHLAGDAVATIRRDLDTYRNSFTKAFAFGGAFAASSALNDLAVQLAAVVAEHLSGNELDAQLREEARWHQVVGPAWDNLIRELELVPGALTKISSADLDAAIGSLAVALREWFTRLGFTLEDAPDGTHLFSANPDATSLGL